VQWRYERIVGGSRHDAETRARFYRGLIMALPPSKLGGLHARYAGKRAAILGRKALSAKQFDVADLEAYAEPVG
jgi:hypothetical protein